MNKVQVLLDVDDGCSIKDGNYDTHIIAFFGMINIERYTGGMNNDVDLINDCIEDNLGEIMKLGVKQGQIEIILNESGEMENSGWFKYYEIESMKEVD